MRKHSRIRFAAAAAAVGLLALAGCSSGSVDEPSGEPEQGTIDWWGWNPDDSQYQEIVDLFNEEYPDITVNYRFIQFSDYLNALRLGLTSGDGPDVFGVQTGAMATQFAPLSADLTPYLTENLGDDWSDQILAADQLNIDGSQMGLPWMVTGGGTIQVNMTLLESLGLEAPTNLDEWQEVCAGLETAGYDCLIQGAKDDWQNIDVFQAIANQVEVGYFYDALAGSQPFDSPEMTTAFEGWQELFDLGVIQEGAFGTTAYPDAADTFRSGEAGMIAFGTWQNQDMTQSRLDTYAEQYGDPAVAQTEFLLVPFPNVVEPSGTADLTLFGGPDVAWSMDASSDASATAWTFLSWLSTSQASQERIAGTLQQPGLASVAIDTSDIRTERQTEAVEAQAGALADLAGPRQIESADVQAALGDALASVANGSMTAAEAVTAVQAAIDTAAAA
ncbi:ABC transporter substrate-binding protein [Occultella gossypii]|uniref:Carbohydrate ABC transporter substrate-binding protein n=1 Tax=Occultella gossypii TaxID=2800820 RepID=A0ABS7SF30_9MICO|nr:ABC transporter substrate-binding protein [Occultella gossypii]MBZ2198963.1 carbohydrate ABC transporter substrate-binding protein [Occultella gossypii]